MTAYEIVHAPTPQVFECYDAQQLQRTQFLSLESLQARRSNFGPLQYEQLRAEGDYLGITYLENPEQFIDKRTKLYLAILRNINTSLPDLVDAIAERAAGELAPDAASRTDLSEKFHRRLQATQSVCLNDSMLTGRIRSYYNLYARQPVLSTACLIGILHQTHDMTEFMEKLGNNQLAHETIHGLATTIYQTPDMLSLPTVVRHGTETRTIIGRRDRMPLYDIQGRWLNEAGIELLRGAIMKTDTPSYSAQRAVTNMLDTLAPGFKQRLFTTITSIEDPAPIFDEASFFLGQELITNFDSLIPVGSDADSEHLIALVGAHLPQPLREQGIKILRQQYDAEATRSRR